jgi:copper transport protein
MAGWLPTCVRRGLTAVALAVAVLLLAPSAPASAHAELVDSTPANGARLDKPPAQVTLTFTEGVNLIDGGIRLVDSLGDPVSTPAPSVDGRTVRWRMPSGLDNGKYLVSWRVVSADGHPVQGAFSFGIGVDAQGVVGAGSNQPATAPAPVVLIRFAGYLAFALLIGVVAFVTWCSPSSRKDSTAHLLGRVALVAGLVTTAAGLLVQGPYVAGVGWSTMFDVDLLRQTAGSPFGQALLWRLALYGVMFFSVWMLEWLEPVIARWLVAAGLVALSVTFAASGHAAGSARVVDLAVDAVHVLAAGIWVGGLAVLALVGRSVERRAYQQFSAMAMVAVLALISSGVVNSLLRLDGISQLWQTRYGQVLTVKVLVVALALGAAAVSRRTLQQDRTPGRTVRVEAVITVVVVAITAVLTLTTPPPTLADQSGTAASADRGSAPDGTTTMKLGQGRTARLRVAPPTTAGSRLSVTLLDARNRPLSVNRVALQVSLPSRNVEGLKVPLRRRASVWVGSFTFPVEGLWKATLTVEDKTLAAVVAVGDLQIGG